MDPNCTGCFAFSVVCVHVNACVRKCVLTTEASCVSLYMKKQGVDECFCVCSRLCLCCVTATVGKTLQVCHCHEMSLCRRSLKLLSTSSLSFLTSNLFPYKQTIWLGLLDFMYVLHSKQVMRIIHYICCCYLECSCHSKFPLLCHLFHVLLT